MRGPLELSGVAAVALRLAGAARGNFTTPGGGLNIKALKDEAWRIARSPDRFTETMTGPVLLWSGGQDGSDPSIPPFVDRAQAHGKAVTWAWFPDEGHGLASAANRQAVDVLTSRFLATCLGGLARPFGDVLERAPVVIHAGAEHVPGLEEAVRARASLPLEDRR